MNRYLNLTLMMLLVFILVMLSGCQGETRETQTPDLPWQTPTMTNPASEIESGESTSTVPPEPTETSEPLAALVNGEGITMAEYEAELRRFSTAGGTELVTITEEDVIEQMITERLLAQGAEENGFTVDEAALQSRIEELSLSEVELAEWMEQNLYTDEEFRAALRRSIAAAWMRDQIIGAVPQAVEQVHAQQIFVYTNEDAQAAFNSLEAGTEFNTLASEYDPITRGELGWFPRGYLTESAVEDAAFNLEPGQYSTIIETRLGYHIIYVSERDPQHALTTDARLKLQHQALQQWLETRRSEGIVEVFLP